MAFDPWAGAKQGIDSFNNSMMTIAQLQRDDQQQAQRDSLLDLQKQQTQQGIDQNKITLAELGAKKNALIDQYGTAAHTDPYASAVSFQNQEEQDRAVMERKQKGLDVYLNTIKSLDGLKTLDEKTKTAIGKHLLALNPEYKPMADNLTFVGSETVKAARMYQSGELIDPVTKQPLPAGYYETEGRWTGDAANPVELLSYKYVEQKPDAEKLLDKRFENQQKLQSEQIAAADRRAAAQIAAADRRSAERADGSSKAPSGYKWKEDGSLQAIPGGPGDQHGKGGKVLPAGQLESIADMKRVKDVMAEARQALNSKKIETGPVVGRLQSLGSSVGLASDNFVDVQQKLQTAENIMLKLRSGAAVTESEYSRFQKEFPRVSDTPEVMKRKMNNAIAYANTLMDDKLSIYEEGGYRIPQSVKSGGQATAAPARPAAKTAPKAKAAGYADLLNKHRK